MSAVIACSFHCFWQFANLILVAPFSSCNITAAHQNHVNTTNTWRAGISDAADQAQENADKFERDAQGVVGDIEEVFDNAADQAAEKLSSVQEQVQSAAQGAVDTASNFADSLQSELLPYCPMLCSVSDKDEAGVCLCVYAVGIANLHQKLRL